MNEQQELQELQSPAKLSDAEAKEKLQERVELIEKLMSQVAQVFDENIPCAILVTPEGHEIAHTVTLNLFMRLSHSLGHDREQIVKNIDKFFE